MEKVRNFLNRDKVIILILLFLIVFGVVQFFNMRGNLKNRLSSEIKLKEALLDTVETYVNELGEYESEKKTLQGDIDDLLNENEMLTEEQSNFLKRIKEINRDRKKDRQIWAAAEITYKTMIDSLDRLLNKASSIDTINNIITFTTNPNDSSFIYDIDILNVKPIEVPEIKFNKINFPNKQTIEFSFDEDRRKDYPVSFTIKNTNKYFKVYDINSYVIPEIQKQSVNPNGWQKIWKWTKQNGKYALVGVAGFAVGSVVSGN